MKSSSFTFAILIPAHNEELCISRCIESCLNQTRKPNQIVVVNDGSTDGTLEELKKFNGQIEIVNVPTATGNKSRAQEIGLQYITSDVFIVTDGDTVLDSHFIEEIECTFLRHPDTAAVAGYVHGNSFNYLTAIREIDYVLGQNFYKLAQSYLNYIFVIAGCAGAFKTKLFTEGIVTIEHDTLTEDLDFTFKIHRLGLPIRFNMRAVCHTQDPHTLHSYVNQMRRWYAGGWQNLLKHLPIIFKSPSAAWCLAMGYLEGFFFPILLFIALISDVYLFVWSIGVYTLINIACGAYAAICRRDIRLFLYSPLSTPIKFIQSYLYIEQFFKEIVFRKREVVWFSPERRVM